MIDMTMNATIRQESENVECMSTFFRLFHCLRKCFDIEKCSIFNGVVDTCQTLINDSSRSNIQMADFRVPHLPLWKAYCFPACSQLIVGIGVPKTVKVRGVCLFDSIPFLFFPQAKTIQYNNRCQW